MTMRPGSHDILAKGSLDIGRDRIATILRRIERGWKLARVRPGVEAGTHEVELNECLRDGMREAVKPRTGGRRGRKFIVAGGTETRSSSARRRPDGRTDIALYLPDIFEAYRDHDPHAIIECKRIAEDNPRLCREYVKEGIDRFASGKYGSRYANGFMAGYLMSGRTNCAAAGINRHLLRKRRRDECMGSSTVLNADWVRTSRHPRPKTSVPITLHHAFLELTPSRAGRTRYRAGCPRVRRR